MGATFSLGRLAGIRIGMHWSVLVIFVLIAVGLAAGRLPDSHPDRPAWLYAVVGVATAVVFLLSLLVHEISHAIIARRNGVASDEITLWLLGGAARLKSEAPSPAAELRIAGIGPLVSLALGVVFALLTILFGSVFGTGLLVEALAWLAAINVLLALFNALPAAPLDGGRLLRALVWWRTGSRLRATAVATGAGRALGWLLIAAGVFLAFAGAAVDGLWLMLIGWFMTAMASAEGSQAKMRELLGSVPVRRAMTPDPTTVPADTTIGEFLTGPPWIYRHSTVADVLVPLDDLPTAHPDDRLIDLLTTVDTSPARRALVLAEDRLVGIVTQSDINRVISWLTSASPADGHRSIQP